MPARHKARKRALDILYAAEMRRSDPVTTFDSFVADGEAPGNPYTETLVRGVAEHLAEIDEILSSHSVEWQLSRMPVVDRNVLRIGVWELRYADDVPPAVAINEATGLVKELSTDESPAFVNGVLDAVRRTLQT